MLEHKIIPGTWAMPAPPSGREWCSEEVRLLDTAGVSVKDLVSVGWLVGRRPSLADLNEFHGLEPFGGLARLWWCTNHDLSADRVERDLNRRGFQSVGLTPLLQFGRRKASIEIGRRVVALDGFRWVPGMDQRVVEVACLEPTAFGWTLTLKTDGIAVDQKWPAGTGFLTIPI